MASEQDEKKDEKLSPIAEKAIKVLIVPKVMAVAMVLDFFGVPLPKGAKENE